MATKQVKKVDLQAVVWATSEKLAAAIRTYCAQQPLNDLVDKKTVHRIGAVLLKELRSSHFKEVSLLLALVQELISAEDNMRSFICFEALKVFYQMYRELLQMKEKDAFEVAKDLLAIVEEFGSRSHNGKRATGKLFLLDMWHLVKETATDCGPLMQSRNSNDVAELKLIAAEIVNILFQDCRENIRRFTMSFHFYTELNTIFQILKDSTDYPTQAILFEIFYRLARKEDTANIETIFGAGNLTNIFTSVKGITFREDTRRFLLELNTLRAEDQKIYSFKVNQITVNDLSLTETWVDFGTAESTFWIDTKSCNGFSDEDFVLIRVPYQCIECVIVSSQSVAFIVGESIELLAELKPTRGKNRLQINFKQDEDVAVLRSHIVPNIIEATNGKVITQRKRKASRAAMLQLKLDPTPLSPDNHARLEYFSSQEEITGDHKKGRKKTKDLQELQGQEKNGCSERAKGKKRNVSPKNGGSDKPQKQNIVDTAEQQRKQCIGKRRHQQEEETKEKEMNTSERRNSVHQQKMSEHTIDEKGQKKAHTDTTDAVGSGFGIVELTGDQRNRSEDGPISCTLTQESMPPSKRKSNGQAEITNICISKKTRVDSTKDAHESNAANINTAPMISRSLLQDEQICTPEQRSLVSVNNNSHYNLDQFMSLYDGFESDRTSIVNQHQRALAAVEERVKDNIMQLKRVHHEFSTKFEECMFVQLDSWVSLRLQSSEFAAQMKETGARHRAKWQNLKLALRTEK